MKNYRNRPKQVVAGPLIHKYKGIETLARVREYACKGVFLPELFSISYQQENTTKRKKFAYEQKFFPFTVDPTFEGSWCPSLSSPWTASPGKQTGKHKH